MSPMLNAAVYHPSAGELVRIQYILDGEREAPFVRLDGARGRGDATAAGRGAGRPCRVPGSAEIGRAHV